MWTNSCGDAGGRTIRVTSRGPSSDTEKLCAVRQRAHPTCPLFAHLEPLAPSISISTHERSSEAACLLAVGRRVRLVVLPPTSLLRHWPRVRGTKRPLPPDEMCGGSRWANARLRLFSEFGGSGDHKAYDPFWSVVCGCVKGGCGHVDETRFYTRQKACKVAGTSGRACLELEQQDARAWAISALLLRQKETGRRKLAGPFCIPLRHVDRQQVPPRRLVDR